MNTGSGMGQMMKNYHQWTGLYLTSQGGASSPFHDRFAEEMNILEYTKVENILFRLKDTRVIGIGMKSHTMPL